MLERLDVTIVQCSADEFLEQMWLTPADWSAVVEPQVALIVVDLRERQSQQAAPPRTVMPACVVVGTNSTSDEVDKPHFVDLTVASADELALLGERVSANPCAATVLVQLLRQTLALSVPQALLAESLAYSTLQHGAEFSRFSDNHTRSERAAHDDPAVLLSRVASELRLRFNRAAKRNAYSAQMRDGLCEALQVARLDSSIERIHLSGAGPSFCAGGDLDEFGLARDAAVAHLSRSTLSAGGLMHELAGKIQVDVQGACVGAGIELPAFADRIEALPDAVFQLPEVSMGLVPGAGGTVSLPRRIGCHRTAWLALSGAPIDAPTALAWGLIDKVQTAGA